MAPDVKGKRKEHAPIKWIVDKTNRKKSCRRGGEEETSFETKKGSSALTEKLFTSKDQ